VEVEFFNLKRRSSEQSDEEPFTVGFDGSTWSLTDTLPDDNMANGAKKSKTFQAQKKPGRPRKPKIPPIRSQAPLPDNKNNNIILDTNPYSILSDDETSVSKQQNNPTMHVSNQKNSRLPPIVIRGQNLLTITNLVKEKNIVNYNFKLISIGVKIFIQNKDEFAGFQKTLTDLNWQFFSFQPEDERVVKYVLYGLDAIDPEELNKELIRNQLNPVYIKPMTLKTQRFVSETLYLVSFKKGDTNLNELRKTRALFHIIVRWEQYSPKSDRPPPPTQCRRCQMFGHGARNCHMNPRCIRCGENHPSKECIYNTSSDAASKIPDDRVKCANCGGAHTASFSECPERARYEAVVEKIRSRQAGKSIPQSRKPAPIMSSGQQFPSLQHHAASRQAQQQASQRTSSSQNTNNTNWGEQSSNYSQNRNDSNQNLFSVSELSQMMRELIVNLRNCRSRLDQLEVITNLALRFVENGP
jgi:hypothetical protein